MQLCSLGNADNTTVSVNITSLSSTIQYLSVINERTLTSFVILFVTFVGMKVLISLFKNVRQRTPPPQQGITKSSHVVLFGSHLHYRPL